MFWWVVLIPTNSIAFNVPDVFTTVCAFLRCSIPLFKSIIVFCGNDNIPRNNPRCFPHLNWMWEIFENILWNNFSPTEHCWMWIMLWGVSRGDESGVGNTCGASITFEALTRCSRDRWDPTIFPEILRIIPYIRSKMTLRCRVIVERYPFPNGVVDGSTHVVKTSLYLAGEKLAR